MFSVLRYSFLGNQKLFRDTPMHKPTDVTTCFEAPSFERRHLRIQFLLSMPVSRAVQTEWSQFINTVVCAPVGTWARSPSPHTQIIPGSQAGVTGVNGSEVRGASLRGSRRRGPASPTLRPFALTLLPGSSHRHVEMVTGENAAEFKLGFSWAESWPHPGNLPQVLYIVVSGNTCV